MTPHRADPRPRATAAMLAAMGCVSSSTTATGGGSPRPVLIASTGLNYRVWIRDGLEARTLGAGVRADLPVVPAASWPFDGQVRAFLGGVFGI